MQTSDVTCLCIHPQDHADVGNSEQSSTALDLNWVSRASLACSALKAMHTSLASTWCHALSWSRDFSLWISVFIEPLILQESQVVLLCSIVLKALILPLCSKYLALRFSDSFKYQANYLVGGQNLTKRNQTPQLCTELWAFECVCVHRMSGHAQVEIRGQPWVFILIFDFVWVSLVVHYFLAKHKWSADFQWHLCHGTEMSYIHSTAASFPMGSSDLNLGHWLYASL